MMADLYDRLATWSSGKWALLWLALYICFAILFACLNGTAHYRLAKRGTSTTGTVTAKEPDNHRIVWYSYVVAQNNYIGAESAGSRFYQLDIGAPVKVFYLPDNPGISCICDPVAEWDEDKFSIAVAPLVFSTFIIIVSIGRARSRRYAGKRQNP
jgi:hypothetical protein